MISPLAEERLRKLRIVLDEMNADPEILFYRCKNLPQPTIGILFGPPVTKELLEELQFIINTHKQLHGWK